MLLGRLNSFCVFRGQLQITKAVVMATGGLGQVYRHTTNPTVATGDGFAIAHRAGARTAAYGVMSYDLTPLLKRSW